MLNALAGIGVLAVIVFIGSYLFKWLDDAFAAISIGFILWVTGFFERKMNQLNEDERKQWEDNLKNYDGES